MITQPQPPRLLISERTPLGCELLAMSLAGNFPDTAHATSSAEVLKVAQTYSPNVMIISAGLADGPLAGFKTLAVLQSILPFCPVIVMLDDMDRDLIIDAFRAHARAVFCRAEPIQHLIKCVKVVLDGQVWAGSKELKLVLDAFSECTPFHAPASPELLRLTKREFDIATLVAAAQSNKQISRRLNISEHTVKNNLFRIFEKLEIGSRIELAVVMMNMRQSAVSVHAHAQNGDHRVNP